MAKFVPSPDFQEEIRRALAAPDPDPSFAKRLGERLAAPTSALPRRGHPLSSRTRLAWSLGMLLVLLLAAFAIGPRNIVAAMQRLLGYIPGVGLVDDSAGQRVLAEPVTIQREGITVSVTQAVLDSQRSVVLFQVDGIPPSAHPDGEDSPTCIDNPRLVLPDGTQLQIIEGGGNGWGSGYENRMIFPAVPPGVDQAVFVLPCLMDTAPSAAPENWELPLRFVPAPPDLTVVPVLEVSPPLETSAGAEAPSQMGLVLEQVIEMQEAYILIGTFRQGDSLPEAMVMGISAWPEITDAAGQHIPYEPAPDLDLPSFDIGVFPWAYQIPKGFAPPLTITLEAVEVQFPADLSFEFDTGPDPQPGQEWVLNQDLEVAGHTVTLVSAILHEAARENGYELFFRADPDVSNVPIEDPAHMTVGGYGGGSLGEFSAGLIYEGSVPSGRLTFHISYLTARYPGPWTLTWSPAEGSGPVTPLAVPQACLTLEGWLRAIEDPAPLPEGLAGKVIAYGRVVNDGERLSPENAGVFLFDLVGGERQVLGPGTWPSLWRDGSHATYGWTDGLHVVSLANRENQIVPRTTTNDYSPRWSPDGSKLAFVRIDDLNLYLVNPDGSGLRRLTDDPDYELLLDWSADGSRLYYAVPGPDGLSLRSLELATGVARDEFVVDAKGLSAALSPDGRLIAFVGRVPSAMGYGLYLAQANGSDRRLIAQLDHWGLANPVWSPDGQWLLFNIVNSDVPDSEITPALINPETCQAIPLEGIEATVQGWAP